MSRAHPLTVIVTACEDSAALRKCLATVRDQAESLHGELLLVFNTSRDQTPTAAALEPLVDRLLFEPKPGKSFALNAAVAAARGAVIAFTDDDAEPQSGWLVNLTAPLSAPDREARTVGSGGPVRPRLVAAAPDWYQALLDERTTHFVGPRHELADAEEYRYQDGEDTPTPIGANCAFRREVFARYAYNPRLGPNRANGMRGGEDTLIARELLRDGYRIVHCPSARVEHPIDPSRMTLDYVRRGFYLQGVEFVRIATELGARRSDPAAVARRLRRLRMKRFWARLGVRRREDAVRLALKEAYHRGQLDELRGWLDRERDRAR